MFFYLDTHVDSRFLHLFTFYYSFINIFTNEYSGFYKFFTFYPLTLFTFYHPFNYYFWYFYFGCILYKMGITINGNTATFDGTGTLTPEIGHGANLAGMTDVIINGYSEIGDFAFYGITNLNSVSISASVVSIGAMRFMIAPI